MTLAITVILLLSVVVLGISALIATERIATGPSQLDRSVAADLLVAIVIAAIGLWAIYSKQETITPLLLVLSMLGFTGAVVIARMVSERVIYRRRRDKKKEASK